MNEGLWVELAVTGTVTAGIGIAVVRWAMRRAERHVGATIQTASRIVSSALSAGSTYRALDGMAEQLADLFDADVCVVALPTGDGRLFCGPTYGLPNPETHTIEEAEGITGHCYRTGEPVVSPDVASDPRFVHTIRGMKHAIAVPLCFRGRVLGAFELESSTRCYTEGDLRLLQPLSDQIAAALDNMRLRAEAEEKAEREKTARKQLQAISAVVMAGVASASDLDGALQSMIQEISAQMGWESLAVILYAEDGLLYTRAYYGYPLHSTIIAFHPGEGIVGTVAASGVGRLAQDVTKDPDYLDVVTDTRAEMCMPLFAAGRCLGVLNAESPRPGAFTDDDFKLLGTLARQMAIVIERTRIGDLEREALERLKEADRLKDDFVATVSHELRTPLTSIKGYAGTLLARDAVLQPEDRSSFLEVMVKQCDRLASIVDTLLLASRLESGEVHTRPVHFLLDELLEDAAQSSSGEARLQIEVSRGVNVTADRFRVHHILRNLMENACKYSPANSPVLVRASAHDEEVWIEVLDQGPGIPESKREVIFERFHRLAEPGHSAAPGTGLGLFIARRFAHDLGGDLSVHTADEGPWTGAHFILRIPLVVTVGDAEVESESAPR